MECAPRGECGKQSRPQPTRHSVWAAAHAERTSNVESEGSGTKEQSPRTGEISAAVLPRSRSEERRRIAWDSCTTASTPWTHHTTGSCTHRPPNRTLYVLIPNILTLNTQNLMEMKEKGVGNPKRKRLREGHENRKPRNVRVGHGSRLPERLPPRSFVHHDWLPALHL